MRPPCRLPHCIQRRLAPRKYSSLTADGASTHEEYDVAIVGGGPVGLALAGALSMPHGTTRKCCAVVIDKKIVDSSAIVRENLRIALIETSDLDPIRNWEPVPDKYSNRASSITNVAYAFLRGQFFHFRLCEITTEMRKISVHGNTSRMNAHTQLRTCKSGMIFRTHGSALMLLRRLGIRLKEWYA